MSTPFDVLDGPRDDREIVTDFGYVEPLIEELDQFVALPLRLVFGDDFALELGPYTLTEVDVTLLQRALIAYGKADGLAAHQDAQAARRRARYRRGLRGDE